MVKVYRNGSVISYGPSNRSNPPEIQREKGLKAKTYKLTWTHYREIASSAVLLWEIKTNKLTFWTFTFREGSISYPDAVKIWTKFLDNFKKQYRCKGYIWVGELTKKGTPHFHIIADVPFVDLARITTSWNVARNDFSNSGVRLPKDKKTNKTKGSVVTSLDGIVKYLCKYLAKTAKDSQSIDFGARVYARSRNITDTFRTFKTTEDASIIVTFLNQNRDWKRFENQYCAIYSPIDGAKKAYKKLTDLGVWS